MRSGFSFLSLSFFLHVHVLIRRVPENIHSHHARPRIHVLTFSPALQTLDGPIIVISTTRLVCTGTWTGRVDVELDVDARWMCELGSLFFDSVFSTQIEVPRTSFLINQTPKSVIITTLHSVLTPSTNDPPNEAVTTGIRLRSLPPPQLPPPDNPSSISHLDHPSHLPALPPTLRLRYIVFVQYNPA